MFRGFLSPGFGVVTSTTVYLGIFDRVTTVSPFHVKLDSVVALGTWAAVAIGCVMPG